MKSCQLDRQSNRRKMITKTFQRKQFFETLLDGLHPIKKMCLWRELAETLEIKLSRFIEDDELAKIFHEKCEEIIRREIEPNKEKILKLYTAGDLVTPKRNQVAL